MPKFLTREELYRSLQRELPEDVYPDGPPDSSYSTADQDAIAGTLATSYQNLERVYENLFPNTAVERIGDHEITAFGEVADSSLSFEERRTRLIAKYRSRPGITRADVFNAITATLLTIPPSAIEIVPWGSSSGGWVLDESELDISTILNGANQVDAVGPLLCEGPPSAFGKTPEEWAIMQEEAYVYDVRFYGVTLTTEQRTILDLLLTRVEPARSGHVITDGLDPNDKVNGDT